MGRDHPNIILIITDQQRYDTLGIYGAAYMHTPNIDTLGREGTAFTRCFCSAPLCVPARASLFTGCYPHTTGVYQNISPWSDSWIAHLCEAGYHCVNIGKMHTVPVDAPGGFDQRFIVENKDRPSLQASRPHGVFYDEWDKFLANSGVRKPSRETYKREYPQYETALGAYEWPLDERYHADAFVGNMACWFLEQRRSASPLFLVLGFPGPHPPYDPPQRYIDRYRQARVPIPEVTDEERADQPPPQADFRRRMIEGNHDGVRWQEQPSPEQLRRLRRYYAANVTLIDDWIGKVLAVLRQRGYLENAIVVFTSDHGDCLGDHGHIQKWTMYDSVTHVPLLMWSPGRLPAGRLVHALVQQQDLAATLFAMVGLEPPAWESQSLLPAIAGDNAGRSHVFAEETANSLFKGVSFVTMVRSLEHKLVHYLDQDYGELYDLQEDPQETHNLWTSPHYASVKEDLLRVLRDWRTRDAGGSRR